MVVTADKPTPYAPPSVILNLIKRSRDRGLQSPVNTEVLERSGVSGSLIPRSLQALQILELIDKDGNHTDTLESIRKAPEAEYKQRLVEWLKGVYADVFSYVDPSEDDEIKVRDAFRSHKPIGQQPRMVTLFLGLCGAAGMAPEKPAQPRKRSRITPPSAAKRPPSRKSSKGVSGEVPSPLAGLLASLPPEGNGWTQDQHDKFMKTFGAVLDFCFPITENETPEQEQDNEEDD